MYKCDCCHYKFDEPAVRKERFTDDGRSCYLYEEVCPYCGENSFAEIEEEDEEK